MTGRITELLPMHDVRFAMIGGPMDGRSYTDVGEWTELGRIYVLLYEGRHCYATDGPVAEDSPQPILLRYHGVAKQPIDIPGAYVECWDYE